MSRCRLNSLYQGAAKCCASGNNTECLLVRARFSVMRALLPGLVLSNTVKFTRQSADFEKKEDEGEEE